MRGHITFLGLALALLPAPSANAAFLFQGAQQNIPELETKNKPILIAEKFAIPGKVKVDVDGKQRSFTRKQLRQKNPTVFKLLEKTEKAAQSYRAGGNRTLPLSCAITKKFLSCNDKKGDWYCTIIFNDLLASGCGRLPPDVPIQ